MTTKIEAQALVPFGTFNFFVIDFWLCYEGENWQLPYLMKQLAYHMARGSRLL